MTKRSFLFAIFFHLLYAFFIPPIKIPTLFPSVDITKYNNIREPLETPISTFPITGFYGLIGPHIDYKTIYSLYDLFVGDGLVQGVFLENGTATFVQTLVNTEKLAFETAYGKMPKHMFITMIATVLYHMHFLPNMIGVANTALMTVNNRTFALFERDMPYELAIDFKKKEVRTVGRYNVPFLSTLSGHSKIVQCPKDTVQYKNAQGGHSKIVQCPKDTVQYKNAQGGHSKIIECPWDNSINFKNTQGGYSNDIHPSQNSKTKKLIETIEYYVVQQKVIWYQMNEQFKIQKQFSIPMKYMPMTHDFYSNEDFVILIDSPLTIDWEHLGRTEVPICFQEKMPTYIYVLYKATGKIETYISPKSFYIFHFGSVHVSSNNNIEIYASLYDTMNYNTIYHSGKYRKIVIDPKTKSVNLFKNQVLENLNLDFPVSIKTLNIGNPIVLRSIQNNRINGFYILENLNIKKRILWTDRFICGEPAITYLESGSPILICLAFIEQTKQQFCMTIHLETYEIVEYLISYPLFVGFHATFIENLN